MDTPTRNMKPLLKFEPADYQEKTANVHNGLLTLGVQAGATEMEAAGFYCRTQM
jgi:hypothetical protein